MPGLRGAPCTDRATTTALRPFSLEYWSCRSPLGIFMLKNANIHSQEVATVLTAIRAAVPFFDGFNWQSASSELEDVVAPPRGRSLKACDAMIAGGNQLCPTPRCATLQ